MVRRLGNPDRPDRPQLGLMVFDRMAGQIEPETVALHLKALACGPFAPLRHRKHDFVYGRDPEHVILTRRGIADLLSGRIQGLRQLIFKVSTVYTK